MERGHDPRNFALVAFGGAGPMHSISVVRLLDMATVIAPPSPGVASAYGLLMDDFKNDYARTSIQKPPNYNPRAMENIYRDLESEAAHWLDSEAVPPRQREGGWHYWAVLPPSITSSEPVTKDDSSEAR